MHPPVEPAALVGPDLEHVRPRRPTYRAVVVRELNHRREFGLALKREDPAVLEDRLGRWERLIGRPELAVDPEELLPGARDLGRHCQLSGGNFACYRPLSAGVR